MQVAFSAFVGYNVTRGISDRRFVMKKRVSIIMTLLMAIGLLAGCGSDEGKALHEMKVEKYVTLGEYTGINVTVPSAEVTEQEQMQYLQQIYFANMVVEEEEKITNRAVKEGDVVNIDYEGKKDGVAFQGGTATDQYLGIGTGMFIAGFEDGLVGVKPGETVDLNLTFPAGYQNAELAGQAVVFTVTVNYIYPAYNDEEVASWGNTNYSTMEELRKFIYDGLSAQNQYYYEMNLENAVLEVFMSQCQFSELPEDLVNRYKTNLQNSITAEAASYGADAESLCYYYYGMDLATFLNTYGPESAKQSLAFQAVANAQNLNLSDEELDAKISEAATANGYATVEEFMGTNTKDDYREYFTYEAAVEYLVNNAVVTVE